MTLVVDSVARTEGDSHGWAFQGNNGYAVPTLITGNVFLGIQSSAVVKFASLGIPKKAKILSAFMDVRSVDTRTSGGYILDVNILGAGAWKPSSFGPAWRTPIWDRFKVDVKDTGGTTLINTVPATPTSVRFLKALANPDRHVRLGQAVVPTIPGILGSIVVRGQKIGTPIGNVTLTIVGSDIEGPVLAVSDPILATAFPTSLGDVTFTFSGANQIALAAGTSYFVIMDGDDPLGGPNWTTFNYLTQFFSGNGGRYYGTGFDFDNQNYPGQADVYIALNNNIGTDIPWATGVWSAGGTFTTPDLKDLIQEAVNHATYNSSDPIAIALKSRGANVGQRRIASFSHSTLAPARLVLEFIPGVFDHIVGAGKVTNRIRSKGIVAQIIRGKGQVTQRISSRGTVTQRISKTAHVTTIVRGKGQVTQRITK